MSAPNHTTEHDKLREENDRLRKLLRSYQWTHCSECASGPNEGHCFVCGWRAMSHAPDCELAVALEGK